MKNKVYYGLLAAGVALAVTLIAMSGGPAWAGADAAEIAAGDGGVRLQADTPAQHRDGTRVCDGSGDQTQTRDRKRLRDGSGQESSQHRQQIRQMQPRTRDLQCDGTEQRLRSRDGSGSGEGLQAQARGQRRGGRATMQDQSQTQQQEQRQTHSRARQGGSTR